MWIISTLQIEEKVVNIISSVISLPIEDWTEVVYSFLIYFKHIVSLILYIQQSWEESMSPGIDMLHHYGPLNRSKHASNKNSIPDNATAYNIFDYSRFRRHFSTLLERVTKIVIENPKDTTEEQDKEKDSAEHNQNKRNSSLGETEIAKMMEIAQLAAEQQSSNKRRTFNSSSLEPVEDEENEEDAEDLRQVGYMKSYGSRPVKNEETSEWINEQFELPSSEELFSDLGIWW